MSTTGVVDDWTSWTLFWFQAATSQRRRVFEANFFDRQAEVLLYMDAMRNVIRGAERVLGKSHPALAGGLPR